MAQNDKLTQSQSEKRTRFHRWRRDQHFRMNPHKHAKAPCRQRTTAVFRSDVEICKCKTAFSTSIEPLFFDHYSIDLLYETEPNMALCEIIRDVRFLYSLASLFHRNGSAPYQCKISTWTTICLGIRLFATTLEAKITSIYRWSLQ